MMRTYSGLPSVLIHWKLSPGAKIFSNTPGANRGENLHLFDGIEIAPPPVYWLPAPNL